MQKYFSYLLIIYIYLLPLLNLLSPIINNIYLRYGILIILFVIATVLNKFKFSIRFMGILTLGIIFLLINANIVEHKSYVISDSIAVICYVLLPLYLFSHRLIRTNSLIKIWKYFSLFFTALLPVFYILRINGDISYYDIAYVAHLNILILIYLLFVKKERKALIIASIIINFVFLGIFGSRMILLASIVCLAIGVFFLKKSFKFYMIITALLVSMWLIIDNLLLILVSINSWIREYGFSSRNLNLFITQLSGQDSNLDVILSGRESIYPVITNYLSESGFFPSGLGMTRVLTNNMYYHSHNFLLEMSLIFGYIFSAILIIYFAKKILLILKTEFKYLLLLILVSFLVRSIAGTYFLTDMLFMIVFCIALGYGKVDRRIQ